MTAMVTHVVRVHCGFVNLQRLAVWDTKYHSTLGVLNTPRWFTEHRVKESTSPGKNVQEVV